MPYDESKLPHVTSEAESDEHRQSLRDYITSDLYALLRFAQRNGFVITVDTAPLEPLAMGHYRMRGNVRAAR